jgi:hypothetical protein
MLARLPMASWSTASEIAAHAYVDVRVTAEVPGMYAKRRGCPTSDFGSDSAIHATSSGVSLLIDAGLSIVMFREHNVLPRQGEPVLIPALDGGGACRWAQARRRSTDKRTSAGPGGSDGFDPELTLRDRLRCYATSYAGSGSQSKAKRPSA